MVEKSGVEKFLLALGLRSSWLKSPGLESSWLKSPGLIGLGLKLETQLSLHFPPGLNSVLVSYADHVVD